MLKCKVYKLVKEFILTGFYPDVRVEHWTKDIQLLISYFFFPGTNEVFSPVTFILNHAIVLEELYSGDSKLLKIYGNFFAFENNSKIHETLFRVEFSPCICK